MNQSFMVNFSMPVSYEQEICWSAMRSRERRKEYLDSKDAELNPFMLSTKIEREKINDKRLENISNTTDYIQEI
jgi:hypothetical protein